jgi:hypothetical protein
MVSQKDRKIIRELALKWMELASLDVMTDRKRLWKAVHDLKAERPVILFETAWVDGFVLPEEILCEDPFLRRVEQNMRITLRHVEELGDDIVIEPYYRFAWRMNFSDYGVPVEMRSAAHTEETDLAYKFSFPIATPDDIRKLKKRTISVDREMTMMYKGVLEEVMGDILDVRVGGFDPFIYEYRDVEYGDSGFCGQYFFGLTWQVYRFIGNQGLLYWPYDSPDAIHKLMRYMLEDRIAMFEYFQDQGLLVPNTDNQMAGPRSYGYVSDLPDADKVDDVMLGDLWGFAESQESENISPAMYKEFVLPYLAKLSEKFGLVYYGCCERLDDRLDLIMDAIGNLRSVSVSGWTDFSKAAEMLGNKYVYSRKPTPTNISGAYPDWELLEQDMKKTYAVTKDSNLEILFRDVYTINGDRERLKRWVEMTKNIFNM